MCLIVLEECHPTLQPLIAEEDIICYKVLEEMSGGSFRTPYREVIISNNVLSSKYFQNVPKIIHYGNFAIVEKGIHSFKTLNAAREEILVLNSHFQDTKSFIIKEAIIPKDIKYWTGYNNELCSEKIVFTEK